MRELRRDPITNDIVVLAKNRNKRPMDKVKFQNDIETKESYIKNCPFCRGNEKHTERSTFEIIGADGWLVRSVYNKFPIVEPCSDEIYGEHEVMIDTNRHNGSFYNMSEKEFLYLLKMYKNRYISLSKNIKVRYVSIFKNFLRRAGASLNHPHSQIISLSIIPPEVENEINISKRYYEKYKMSLYQNIIEEEIKYEKRIIHDNKDYLVMVPEISKYGGEIRILFKQNTRFENIKESDLNELAIIFKKLFRNIYIVQGYNPFNICIHTHPINGEDHDHFYPHIHIIPRKYSFGGFELATDVYVSSIDADKLAQSLKFT
ncbi:MULTISPECIES: galactose-1-phosphate uridylyltransferase [unclassified Romboutsia]|uniref:galactose-1-phosphate uridylyltransferase n=1 Tax=unclassified Romboutsia TaxID=2626894 RepID=UPI0008233D85|nr:MULTISPECIES: galactose-1-phosphate uridylyltransferase [unclassified Romboutsia]SCH04593.1 Galactose-1-phosphate uridylyltransferase [uncultured Clostridium sp.]